MIFSYHYFLYISGHFLLRILTVFTVTYSSLLSCHMLLCFVETCKNTFAEMFLWCRSTIPMGHHFEKLPWSDIGLGLGSVLESF